MQTIRLFPTPQFPLVPIECRACGNSCEDCDTCANEGAVLVDEVMECDTVLDDDALEVHLAAREAHFAPIRAAQAARAPWPPRCPTPAEHAEIQRLHADYRIALALVRAPRRAA